MSVTFAIAQLRHLYAQLYGDSVVYQRGAAQGLLAPAIRDFEQASHTLNACGERITSLVGALRNLLVAVDRVALARQWQDASGEWSTTLPGDVQLLVEAHEVALALIDEAPRRGEGEGE